MKKVETKYRGTKEFLRVYRTLITAAEYRGTVRYVEIARILGIGQRGGRMSKEVGQVLGEVSEDEHRARRPMLSAVVVGSEGIPGKGFFTLARQLGKLHDADQPSAQGFWEEERDRVYDEWAIR